MMSLGWSGDIIFKIVGGDELRWPAKHVVLTSERRDLYAPVQRVYKLMSEHGTGVKYILWPEQIEELVTTTKEVS